MKEGPQLLQIASTTKQYLIWNFSGTFNYTAVKWVKGKKKKKEKIQKSLPSIESKNKKLNKTYDGFLTYRQ